MGVRLRYGSPAFYFTIPWHVLIIRHTLSVIAVVAQRKRQISGRSGIGSPYILILIYIKTFPVLKKRRGCSLKGGGTIARESAEQIETEVTQQNNTVHHAGWERVNLMKPKEKSMFWQPWQFCSSRRQKVGEDEWQQFGLFLLFIQDYIWTYFCFFSPTKQGHTG